MSRLPHKPIMESDEYQLLHPPQPRQNGYVRLRVEELTKEPPSYLVRHRGGHQWLVITASDGNLEVAEEETVTKVRALKLVLNAVRLFQAEH